MPSRPTTPPKTMTSEEWLAEGETLFGADRTKWKFVCPVCGHIATPEDWHKAGAPDNAIAHSCVGRWLSHSRDAFRTTGVGPCDYAGGGLFRLNPITVEGTSLFAFAEITNVDASSES